VVARSPGPGLDDTFTDSFGTAVDLRRDMHLNKVSIQVLGWLAQSHVPLPRLRLDVHASQGLGGESGGSHLRFISAKHIGPAE
jgi:hypothetical protein